MPPLMRTASLNSARKVSSSLRIFSVRFPYFLRPTDRFFSRRSFDLHFLHRSALIGFLAPQRKQTLKNSLLFWAICFLAASAMGKFELSVALGFTTKKLSVQKTDLVT